MQYETVLGLRREHTFDEVRSYIQDDPDKIVYPKRDAFFFFPEESHLWSCRASYAQLLTRGAAEPSQL